MAHIDGDRLLTSLGTLRSFGATGNGVVRTALSDVDMAARRWLAEQMRSCGLDATIDGVGNVFGRSPNPGPSVLLGSHSDTQPQGGWLDGAMGVMHAIEVARSLADDPETSGLAVDVVSWSDEEGTYASFLGSRSYVGEVGDDELSSTNASGDVLRDALARADLSTTARATLSPGEHVAYLETHIEQGPVLDDEDLLLGVVTGIVGIRTLAVTFTGQQNHAGTTPMPRRRDAMTAFVGWAADLHDRMPSAAGPSSVWTIGSVDVDPGAQSIVPGTVRALLQFRDPSEVTLDAMERLVRQLGDDHDGGSAGVAVTVDRHGAPVEAQPMDDQIRATLCRVAETTAAGRWREMPSAAGHDAQVLAPHVPTGMLFIPSIDGVSHDFAEDSRHDDIVLGAEALLAATIELLG